MAPTNKVKILRTFKNPKKIRTSSNFSLTSEGKCGFKGYYPSGDCLVEIPFSKRNPNGTYHLAENGIIIRDGKNAEYYPYKSLETIIDTKSNITEEEKDQLSDLLATSPDGDPYKAGFVPLKDPLEYEETLHLVTKNNRKIKIGNLGDATYPVYSALQWIIRDQK